MGMYKFYMGTAFQSLNPLQKPFNVCVCAHSWCWMLIGMFYGKLHYLLHFFYMQPITSRCNKIWGLIAILVTTFLNIITEYCFNQWTK